MKPFIRNMSSLDLDTITDDIEVDRFFQILCSAYKNYRKFLATVLFDLFFNSRYLWRDSYTSYYIIKAKTLFI